MEKWYQKTGVIIALLIFFWPVGLYLMWKYTDWNKNVKIAITAVLVVLCIYSIVSANSRTPATQEESKVEEEEQKEVVATVEPTKTEKQVVEEKKETPDADIVVGNLLKKPDFTAEKNSSEMVDQIGFTAKKYASELTDVQADQIATAVRAADHNYYDSNDDMEKFMWYGYLLDYKYDDGDQKSELGTDLVQAVKYVYRGVEKVEDEATQANLLQIDKSLAAIYQEESAIEETEEEVSEEPAEEVTEVADQEVQETQTEEMVYLPESGEKYHNDKNCSGMENPQQVTISEAEAMGYEPCKRCY